MERLSAAERRERFAWFDAGDEPAVFSPDTGVIAADAAMRALAAAARGAGAAIRDETAVERLEIAGDEVRLFAGDDEIRARHCVVAAGAWVADLLRPLGIDLPARVTRERVFYFRAASPILPFIHRGKIARYGVPTFGDAPGVKIAEHMTGPAVSADQRDLEPDADGAARIRDYVRATLPSFDPDPISFETCLYTTTSDEGFVIDAEGPLVIASACSGHGFKFGPATGDLIAAAVDGDVRADFSLRRFSSTGAG